MNYDLKSENPKNALNAPVSTSMSETPNYSPSPIETLETLKELEEEPIIQPVHPRLLRIFDCESGNTQLDQNGKVIISKTGDVGIAQINEKIHGKTAEKMGLDLRKESDNKKFANWLFSKYGIEPWRASELCWND